jgi:hypothetical protein
MDKFVLPPVAVPNGSANVEYDVLFVDAALHRES